MVGDPVPLVGRYGGRPPVLVPVDVAVSVGVMMEGVVVTTTVVTCVVGVGWAMTVEDVVVRVMMDTELAIHPIWAHT